MNDFSSSVEFNPSADIKVQNSVPTPAPVLTEADIQSIRRALTQGEDSLAKRKDIGEMHKRIVAMFATLNQGLAESQDKKAADDRIAIERRLEAMERSIDTMEGALRIELPPMLQEMVIEVAAARNSGRAMPTSRIVMWTVVFCIGMAIGSFLPTSIASAVTSIFSTTADAFGTSFQKSSPNGGSLKPANLVN